MSGLLLGKLALVTGSGSGIGRATCRILAKEGATVISADVNLESAKQSTKDLKRNNDLEHAFFKLDVKESSDVTEILNRVLEKYKKPPTIIVNSAGITRDNFLLQLSQQDFDDVINVNLRGTFFVVQTFAKSIIEHKINGASIINIASIVGKYGNIGQANYCASKAGVELLTKVASKEFGRYGIRCNSVLPGFIQSPMTKVIPDKVKEKFVKMISLGRFGDAEEVAEVISFLASDKSRYVNGASIEVTGGF